YVQSVQEGSAAALAGIQKGDVIIDIEGEAITNATELNKIKNNYKAGDTIKITISRAGEDITVEMVLQEANADKFTDNPLDNETDASEN
ncbi:MAG: PDZ domain-containing protein, partial [Ruminococcus sp.]|nr:PDZ domain-containing protein [Ruminococcus sp.]